MSNTSFTSYIVNRQSADLFIDNIMASLGVNMVEPGCYTDDNAFEGFNLMIGETLDALGATYRHQWYGSNEHSEGVEYFCGKDRQRIICFGEQASIPADIFIMFAKWSPLSPLSEDERERIIDHLESLDIEMDLNAPEQEIIETIFYYYNSLVRDIAEIENELTLPLSPEQAFFNMARSFTEMSRDMKEMDRERLNCLKQIAKVSSKILEAMIEPDYPVEMAGKFLLFETAIKDFSLNSLDKITPIDLLDLPDLFDSPTC